MKKFEIKYLLKSEILKNVFLFIIITIGFHVLYKVLLPFFNDTFIFLKINDFLTTIVFNQVSFINSKIMNLDFVEIKKTMYFQDYGFIKVTSGCSGLKQFLQFFVLFLLLPGKWTKKLWFIPLGISILHFVNIFRIVGLTIILIKIPDLWNFAHDWFFRPLFYFVIFLMWLLWIERISKRRL